MNGRNARRLRHACVGRFFNFARLLSLAAVTLGLLQGAIARAAPLFTKVVDTTDAAPVGTFNSFSRGAVSGGTVAFLGSYNGSANNGVFTGNGGPLTLIAKEGDPAPGGPLTNLGPGMALSGGTVVFRNSFGASDQRMLSGNGGPLTAVVRNGDPAPVGTFDGGGVPSISGNTVAFHAGYNGGANQGIFTKSGGTLNTIAVTGDPAAVGSFTYFGDAVLSGSTVAFVAGYTDDGAGIFTSNGGAPNAIMLEGDAAPLGTFTGFNAPDLSGNTVAFTATFNGGADSGVFTSHDDLLTVIAKKGDAAPAGVFSSVVGNALLNDGKVAFLGTYGTKNGIFIGDGNTLDTVVRTGDSLFGSTVTFLGAISSRDADGEDVAFSYQLADGRSGIAIATVPEPSSLTLAGLGVLSVALLARQRRLRSNQRNVLAEHSAPNLTDGPRQ